MNVPGATVLIKMDLVSNLPAALMRVIDGCMTTVWTTTTVLLGDCVVLGAGGGNSDWRDQEGRQLILVYTCVS